MNVRRKRIRGLARELLKQAGVTEPPVPVVEITRMQGLQIRLSSSKDSNISGLLFLRSPKPTIGVNAVHHENRQRFTIAHELGHFLLHRFDSEGIHVDHSFPVKLRDDLSSEGVDSEEREANLFAAELLMPVDFLQRELKDKTLVDLEDDAFLQDLARSYQVSPQAMIFRLANLRFITL